MIVSIVVVLPERCAEECDDSPSSTCSEGRTGYATHVVAVDTLDLSRLMRRRQDTLLAREDAEFRPAPFGDLCPSCQDDDAIRETEHHVMSCSTMTS